MDTKHGNFQKNAILPNVLMKVIKQVSDTLLTVEVIVVAVAVGLDDLCLCLVAPVAVAVLVEGVIFSKHSISSFVTSSSCQYTRHMVFAVVLLEVVVAISRCCLMVLNNDMHSVNRKFSTVYSFAVGGNNNREEEL